MAEQVVAHTSAAGAQLEGSVCLVTGASRGVGRETATRLVRAGAHVLGTFRFSEDEARELAMSLRDDAGSIDLVRCDITDGDDVSGVAAVTIERFGRIDVLVNNAGIWRGGALVKLPERSWRDVIETNLMGVFRVTQAVLPTMLDAGSGRIVNVTSIVGMLGYPGDTAYGAAKAGLIGFTKSLAKELAGKGITVNAVAPGSLTTDMTGELNDKAQRRLLERIPAGRRGDPMEVADVITYLAAAPTYLTGAIIPIAGAM